MTNPNIFTSPIYSVAEDGSGIAKCDGYTVFVKGLQFSYTGHPAGVCRKHIFCLGSFDSLTEGYTFA